MQGGMHWIGEFPQLFEPTTPSSQGYIDTLVGGSICPLLRLGLPEQVMGYMVTL